MRLGFDIDRVIFDTNAYFDALDSRLKEKRTSIEEIFQGNYGRKDLDLLHSLLVKKFGRMEADALLFENLEGFLNIDLLHLFNDLKDKGHLIYLISVGDRHQKKKAKRVPKTRAYVVKSDYDKAEKAAKLRIELFFDDKVAVVQDMRSRGISAFQVLWYLDADRRKGALPDAIESVDQIKDLLRDRGVL